MPIDWLEYKGEYIPSIQKEGNAAQYSIPFARVFCKGKGVDVGCKKTEWCLPWAIPIDIDFNETDSEGNLIEAYNIPYDDLDFVFSSNCVEHLRDWVEAIDYWYTKLKKGGVMMLYLPHYNSRYWRSWNNRKHIHNLSKQQFDDYFKDRYWSKWIVTDGYDLMNCFYVIAEK